MKQLLRFVPTFLLLIPMLALAAVPPKDVRVLFDAPEGGGPVSRYNLYTGCGTDGSLDGASKVGAIQPGGVVQGAVPTYGTFTFCATAQNESGEGPVSDVASLELPMPVPGKPRNFRIELICQGECEFRLEIFETP
jgi:hypothetical protein